jgi:ribosome-associated toxin RatA of RatAB toxin-antitoxin module
LAVSARAALRYLLAALAMAAAVARAADDFSVETTRRGEAVEVICRATLQASRDLIWQTLTDYNRLADFVPGMLRSRVLEVRGPTAIVEQVGEARFLLFSFPIEVTVASTERPPDGIEVQLLKGNLKRLAGAYRIEPLEQGRYVLHWRGILEPETPMPPLIGELVMRSSISDQFQGMVREIERREALQADGDARKAP